jgi:hypothetical protein
MKLSHGLAWLTLCACSALATSSCFLNASGGEEGNPSERRIEPKVAICHIPPFDPSSAETREVDQSTLLEHLGPNDRLGPCTERDRHCTAVTRSCATDDECCTGSCYRSRCEAHCRADGQTCDTDEDCCSEACHAGKCTE